MKTCHQFHQHFSYNFFCTNVVLAAFSTYTKLEKKLQKQHSYEKFVRITLMKLTPILFQFKSNSTNKNKVASLFMHAFSTKAMHF
jgi:hypothetical protein